MQPSVGRTVHYQSYGTPGGEYGSVCRAAIITAVPNPDAIPMTPYDVVPEGTVDLCVLNPEGMFFNRGVRYGVAQDETHAGGTWHWPERVPE